MIFRSTIYYYISLTNRSYQLLHKKNWLMKPGVVTLSVGEVIHVPTADKPAQVREESIRLAELAFRQIQNMQSRIEGRQP